MLGQESKPDIERPRRRRHHKQGHQEGVSIDSWPLCPLSIFNVSKGGEKIFSERHFVILYRATDIVKSKKKTKVMAEDVFMALKELDFEKYEEELRDFLRNYNADKEDQAMRRAPAALASRKQSAIIEAQPEEIKYEEEDEDAE